MKIRDLVSFLRDNFKETDEVVVIADGEVRQIDATKIDKEDDGQANLILETKKEDKKLVIESGSEEKKEDKKVN